MGPAADAWPEDDGAEADAEADAGAITLVLPPDLDFATLALHRGPNATLRFNREPMRRLAAANGHPPAMLDEANGDDIASLIYQWYQVHRLGGGAPDAVYEDCLRLMNAQDAFERDLEPDGPPH